jgi:DNA polymerase-1
MTYKNQIPEIETFKAEAIQRARKEGFVSTYYGRKRFLQNILSPDLLERKKSERQAINHMIQGTGADIAKFALVKLHNEGFAIDTMLHDGILITVPDAEVEQSMVRIRAIMEIEIEGTRFPVSCKTGKCWAGCYKKSGHESAT